MNTIANVPTNTLPTAGFTKLVDPNGNPYPLGEVYPKVMGQQQKALGEVQDMQREIMRTISSNNTLKARHDAAQTHLGNELHWSQADAFSPNMVASFKVRQTLRKRSRYEVLENNPYLKGMVLTIANDFVKTCPKLRITDSRIDKVQKRTIQRRWAQHALEISLPEKLWQIKMDKVSAGESFLIPWTDLRLQDRDDPSPLLNVQVNETDQISTLGMDTTPYSRTPGQPGRPKSTEIDGVRLGNHGEPTHYFKLDQHPGDEAWMYNGSVAKMGKWIREDQMSHWFRKDRNWIRGIPEATPSLPLCAILRRYTMAVLRAAEFAADVSGVLETDGPPNESFWSTLENLGQAVGGDSFPTESGMFVTTPWGYKLKQIDAKQPMQVYDMFVDMILREIARPLLVPFNFASGSSADSNMASAVVDGHIYKAGQEWERYHCEMKVLRKYTKWWWREATRIPGYFDEPGSNNRSLDQIVSENPSLRNKAPEHTYGWSKVGLDHTDPLKVANAHTVLHEHGLITDKDYQENVMNRSTEEWQEQHEEQREFRDAIGIPTVPSSGMSQPQDDGDNSDNTPPSKNKKSDPATA